MFNLSFLSEYVVDKIFDSQDFICLYTIKWFQFIIFFGKTPSFSEKTERRSFDVVELISQTIHLEKLLSDDSESSAFYENVFNGARRLTCQTLWLLFLFQYVRINKFCMINTQSGYNDLFSSCFSLSQSPFSQSGVDGRENWVL